MTDSDRSAPPHVASQTSKPNIVFFTWHDAGDWFGCYGYDNVQTPNVDRLAGEGVRFDSNFSACAICSPSRAAIMTGRHPQESGLMRLANTVFDDRIHPHIPHLAKQIKGMGYHTALLGVQHEAAHEHVEEVMGFDERYATDPWPNGDIIAHYADQWLRERADCEEPFYMQVGSYDSHLNRYYSNQPPRGDEAYAPVQDRSRGTHIPPYLEDNQAGHETVATLQGLLQRGDRLLGTILDALDATGQAENTIVVMCVDHGVGLPRAKTTCYDPGLKTGWLMRWPEHIPAGHTVKAMTTHVDVMPTLRDILGWNLEGELDGHSFSRHALGCSEENLRASTVAHMTENVRCLRTGRWKLIRNFKPLCTHAFLGDCAEAHQGYPNPPRPDPTQDQVPDTMFPDLELYDLEADPNETLNLATDPSFADVCKRLDAELWDFLLDHRDFTITSPVRNAWQRETRRQLEAHCRRGGRSLAQAEGTYGNPIDAAASRGRVVSLDGSD